MQEFIKVKNHLSYLLIFIAIFALSGTLDATGHRLSLLEASLLALIIYMPNRIFWSDWMYDYILENGANISYSSYQKSAIFVYILFIVALISLSPDDHFKLHIGLLWALLISIEIYIFIMKSIQER